MTEISDQIGLLSWLNVITKKALERQRFQSYTMKIRLYESVVLAKLPRSHEAQTWHIIVTAANIEKSVALISDRRGNP